MKVQQTENLLRVQIIAVFILLLQYRKNQLKKIEYKFIDMNIYCFPYIFAFNIDPFHCISFHFLFNRFSTTKWTYVLFSFICKESKPNNATCLRSFGTTFVQFTKKTTCDPCILSLALCVITISVLFLHLISMISSILFSEMDCYSQLYRTDRTKIYTIQIKPVYWSVETIRNLRKIMDCMK